MDSEEKSLEELFKLAEKVGNRRYNRLTLKDLEDYHKFDHWRHINGKGECGPTQESKDWIRNNSDSHCPVCGNRFADKGGRSIDHKLPRAQYPWLSLDFRNLWVICHDCNQEKGEMHWFEYERYMMINHPDRYEDIAIYRPRQLLQSLQQR